MLFELVEASDSVVFDAAKTHDGKRLAPGLGEDGVGERKVERGNGDGHGRKVRREEQKEESTKE